MNPALHDAAARIVKNGALTDNVAAAVSWYVQNRCPEGTVLFYGCGGITQSLLKTHAETLAKCNYEFLLTSAEPGQHFESRPVKSLQEARAMHGIRVLVMSDAYRSQMLANLDFLPRSRVITLDEMVIEALRHGVLSEALLLDDDVDTRAEVARLVTGVLSATDCPSLNLFLLENFHKLVAAYRLRSLRNSGSPTAERSPFVYPYY